MTVSPTGATSAQQLALARAQFAAFSTAQPTSNFSNGQATNPGAATTGSQQTGTATPAGTTVVVPTAGPQPVTTGAPTTVVHVPPPLVIPRIHIKKGGDMGDTLTAISGAMVDPTTSQQAVTVLYDFQKSLFDMAKQSTSLWLNGSQ